MSDQIDDGGPAFPCEVSTLTGRMHGKAAVPGMSLRDYFASKVMEGYVPVGIGTYHETNGSVSVFDPKAITKDVETAYGVADAMLEARKVKGAK